MPHRAALHLDPLPVPLAASLAPTPELAGLDTASRAAAGQGPFASGASASSLSEQLFPISTVDAPTSLTNISTNHSGNGMEVDDSDASPVRETAVVAGDVQMNGTDENDEEDKEEQEEEEEPASGSEFSAGSEDVKKREEEDEQLEQERLNAINGSANTNGINGHAGSSAATAAASSSSRNGSYIHKQATALSASITQDAELDPDLYGLRRSVSC